MRKLLLGVVVLSSLAVFPAAEAEAGWRIFRPRCQRPICCRRERAEPVAARMNIREEVEFLRDEIIRLDGEVKALQKQVN